MDIANLNSVLKVFGKSSPSLEIDFFNRVVETLRIMPAEQLGLTA